MNDDIVNHVGSVRSRSTADAEGREGVRSEPTRQFFDVGEGQKLSALVWGTGEPEAVMLHGRGQNAHTWDSVARRLAIPLVAIDLPGHGHSDWRDDHDYGPVPNAPAVASVIQQTASNAKVVVGMSLGGGTTIRLASTYPQLVRRAVVVDSTPANRQGRAPLTAQQRGALALLEGPTDFGSFEEMLLAAAAAVPTRPIESLRRGVLNNSRQLEDGRWTWRYDTQRPDGVVGPVDRSALWNDVTAIAAPIMLVRAGRSGLVLDEDVDEFVRRQPRTRVELVEDAAHSVQSDQPGQLANLIQDFVATTS